MFDSIQIWTKKCLIASKSVSLQHVQDTNTLLVTQIEVHMLHIVHSELQLWKGISPKECQKKFPCTVLWFFSRKVDIEILSLLYKLDLIVVIKIRMEFLFVRLILYKFSITVEFTHLVQCLKFYIVLQNKSLSICRLAFWTRKLLLRGFSQRLNQNWEVLMTQGRFKNRYI